MKGINRLIAASSLVLSTLGTVSEASAHDISTISSSQVAAMNQVIKKLGFVPLDDDSDQKKHCEMKVKKKVPNVTDCVYVGSSWDTRFPSIESNQRTLLVMKIMDETHRAASIVQVQSNGSDSKNPNNQVDVIVIGIKK